MKKIVLSVMMLAAVLGGSCAQKVTASKTASQNTATKAAQTPAERPSRGLLFFASYDERDNDIVKTNPYIIGALRTIKWSDIEPQEGKFDWSSIDDFIASWASAGKGIALRMQWSTSGYWKDPQSKTPTPQWVWKKGAKYAYHEPSETEIPLFWDPIYLQYAYRFLGEVAKRYDNNPHVLFIDITPGAETNPFRFRTINNLDPSFKATFEKTPASDGRTYTDRLWQTTILDYIGTATALFKSLPTEIALNRGTLNEGNNFELFGNKAVECGMYIGQNGLSAKRYGANEASKVAILKNWADHTKIFFEMVAGTRNDETGSLQGVMEAAMRGYCSYLNVYADDVIAGTKGSATYKPEYEQALKFGAENLGKTENPEKAENSGR